MRKFKKVVLVAAVAAMMTVGFAGCKKTECDYCEEEKKCKTEEVRGEKVSICEDCEKEMEEIVNDVTNALKGIK